MVRGPRAVSTFATTSYFSAEASYHALRSHWLGMRHGFRRSSDNFCGFCRNVILFFDPAKDPIVQQWKEEYRKQR